LAERGNGETDKKRRIGLEISGNKAEEENEKQVTSYRERILD
jgi:hypothetical protein